MVPEFNSGTSTAGTTFFSGGKGWYAILGSCRRRAPLVVLAPRAGEARAVGRRHALLGKSWQKMV